MQSVANSHLHDPVIFKLKISTSFLVAWRLLLARVSISASIQFEAPRAVISVRNQTHNVAAANSAS
jgi:hypothetical protein